MAIDVNIAALLLRNYLTISAFFILIWEYAITFDDEYQFIWRKPINLIKGLYFTSRYVSLVVQGLSAYFMLVPFSHNLPVPYHPCFVFATSLWIMSCALLKVLVAVLMLRVYALYHRDRSIAILLSSLFSVQCLVAVVSGYQTLRKITFDGVCNALNTPYDVIYLGGTVVLSQSVIWSMTLSKRNIVPGGTPLIYLTLRDGGLAFALVAAIVSMGIPYALHSEDKVSEPHLVFIWPTSMVSIAACRIIVNMQKCKTPGPQSSSIPTLTEVEITSINSATTSIVRSIPTASQEQLDR